MVYGGSQSRQAYLSKCLQKTGVNLIPPSAALALSRGLGFHPPPLVCVLNIALPLQGVKGTKGGEEGNPVLPLRGTFYLH